MNFADSSFSLVQEGQSNFNLSDEAEAEQIRQELDRVHWEDFLPATSDPLLGDEPYTRTLLANEPKYEIILMNWKRATPCAPHDHGDSWGWVKVISGVYKHTEYQWVNNSKTGQRDLSENIVSFFEAGDWIFVPKDMVHTMESIGENSKDNFTLHFYFSPITGMKVFNTESREVLTVTDDCGAWVTENEKQILNMDKY